MDNSILAAVVTLSIMGGAFAGLLGLASKLFYVEVDPKQDEVLEALPGVNCGGCGYVGCAECAKAIVKRETEVDACVVGGQRVADHIASIMGLEASRKSKKVAVVHCNGGCNAKNSHKYNGIQDCRVLVNSFGGIKECKYGCQGCGNCVKECDFEAIRVVNGVALVNPDKCTACGKCVKACPLKIIDLRDYDNYAEVLCRNEEFGRAVTSACSKACMGCTLCTKTAPDSFEMDGKLAFYKAGGDLEKVKLAVEKCPNKAIRLNAAYKD